MCEGQKSNGFKRKWSIHKGPRHHLLVLSQYMGGGPQVKGIRGCGLAAGERGGLFWDPRSNFFGKKCPTRMTSHPKEVNMSYDHLMHAIEISEGEI